MFKQGGDSYVSYIKEGGQLFAACSYQAESIDSQKSIAAELNADISKVKGDLKVAYDRVNARKDIKFNFSLNAIGFGNKKLPKEEELSRPYDFISDINKGKLEEPDILEFATRLYDGVKGHPDMSQIVRYHSLFTRDLEGKKAYSIFKRQALKTKMAIKSLAEVYEFYHQEGVEPKFDRNRRKVEESLRKINDWQYTVHTNPTSTTIGELALDPSCLEVPEPQFHLERSGLRMETNKGDAWEDIDLSMVIQRMYLRSIQVRAGVFIDMLTTIYGFADGYRGDFKREHGAGRAGAQEKFVLGPNQRIDKLELWHQDYHGSPIVKMFAIYTEGNPQRIFFGNDEPTERPYSDQGRHGNANWAFLGFSGWSGQFLDSLKAVYVAFEKPTWRMPDFPESSR